VGSYWWIGTLAMGARFGHIRRGGGLYLSKLAPASLRIKSQVDIPGLRK
jgi:hypothetical protein